MSIEEMINQTYGAVRIKELALGYLRYEALRKLKPHDFTQLHYHSLKTGVTFDSLVDELIEKDGR